jgi:hypothetical protein
MGLPVPFHSADGALIPVRTGPSRQGVGQHAETYGDELETTAGASQVQASHECTGAEEVERPEDSGEEGSKDGSPVTAMGFSGDPREPNCFPNP